MRTNINRIAGLLVEDIDQYIVNNSLESIQEKFSADPYAIVEAFYSRLPSGDYGRGDVKRWIENHLRNLASTKEISMDSRDMFAAIEPNK